MKIAILAYGSLIPNPGDELKKHITQVIHNVETPFNIEFSRTSKTRNNAPTLAVVEGYGSKVKGGLLELNQDIDLVNAESMLWRRETWEINSQKNYSPPQVVTVNTMVVERVYKFHGFDIVLYTKLGENLPNTNAKDLAKLAIASAKSESGNQKRDGISYLIDVIAYGISTPLMAEYEYEILRQTKSKNLNDAYQNSRAEAGFTN